MAIQAKEGGQVEKSNGTRHVWWHADFCKSWVSTMTVSFAPVAKMSSIRTLLSIVAQEDLEADQRSN